MTRIILDKQAVTAPTRNTSNIMLLVLAALVPGIAVYSYVISPIVVINALVAMFSAVVFELLAVKLRGARGWPAVQDGSITVAAVLLALAVPPGLPFWQLLVGVFIMVMLGKQVYGGLGNNPFNPAMVGYAALMISFPQNMTLWFAPGELHSAGFASLIEAKLGMGQTDIGSNKVWDGVTAATPLEQVRVWRLQSLDDNGNSTALSLAFSASGWLWINLAFLLGGLFLLYKKVIQWHIPVAVVTSFTLLTLLLGQSQIPLSQLVFSGALILGAFFIATDPVTAAASNRGRLIFGSGVGALTFTIREFGGYPEGIAFAILLMNLCVPLIDYLDRRPD